MTVEVRAGQPLCTQIFLHVLEVSGGASLCPGWFVRSPDHSSGRHVHHEVAIPFNNNAQYFKEIVASGFLMEVFLATSSWLTIVDIAKSKHKCV